MITIPNRRLLLGSVPWLFVASTILCLGTVWLLTTKWLRTRNLRHIPGPLIARWTNLYLKYHVLAGQRIYYVQRLHQEYGPVVLISPTEVAIADLEATKAIHKVNNGFLKSPWYQAVNNSEHDGIFAMSDVKAHATRRRLLAQSFSKSNVRVWEDLIRTKTDLAIRRVREEAKQEEQADILKWFTFMATDLIGQLSFGDSFRMLEQGKRNDYIKDVESALILSSVDAELPAIVRILSFLRIPAVRRIGDVHAKLARYGRDSIQRHKRQALSGGLGDRPTFFSKMLAAGKSQDLSDAEIEQEASNLIVAGSDTTAITITYLIWAVLSTPHVHDRIRGELQTLPAAYRGEDLERLPYFNATIQEALRLYGAAPGALPRIVPPGGRNLGGYFVPQGMTVTTQAYTLHRDPSIFDAPYDFRPERWLNPTPRMEEAFMPFGAGSRICIGLHLARLEISLASAEFFQMFLDARIGDRTTPEDMAMENYFLIAPESHHCFVRV